MVRLIIFVNLCLAFCFALFLIQSVWQGANWRGDLLAFYTGWRMVAHGDGARLYDLTAQRAYQTEITGRTLPLEHGGVLPFINPPHAVVPFAPLGLLPRPAASGAWLALQLALLTWTITLLLRIAEWSKAERLLLVASVLAFFPLLNALYQGALTLLALLALTQFYLALKRGHDWRAGLWLAIGTVKPQIVLVPALILLAKKKWSAVVSMIVCLIALVALSLPFVGWRAYLEYPALLRTIGESVNKYGVYPATMANLKGLLVTLLGYSGSINTLVYLALACAVVLTFYLWRKDNNFNLHFAFTVLLGLFVAPHLNDQDVLIAVLPAVLFYDYLRRQNRAQTFGAFLCCVPVVLAGAQFITVAEIGKRSVLLLLIMMLVWTGFEIYKSESLETAEF